MDSSKANLFFLKKLKKTWDWQTPLPPPPSLWLTLPPSYGQHFMIFLCAGLTLDYDYLCVLKWIAHKKKIILIQLQESQHACQGGLRTF